MDEPGDATVTDRPAVGEPEPDFAQRLVRAILSEPATRPALLAPAMREPEMARRLDAVAGQVSAALGEPYTAVGQDEGTAVLYGRSRFGLFYSRDAAGLADRIELYPLDRPRGAPLLRTAVVRWVLLAVPVYLAFLLALSPGLVGRALWTIAVLAAVPAQWTNHRWDLTGVRVRPWWTAVTAVALALAWLAGGRVGPIRSGYLDVLVAVLMVCVGLPTILARRERTAGAFPVGLPFGANCRGYVVQGGSSRWLNHHRGHAEQSWAVDLVPVSGPLLRGALAGPEPVAVVAPVAGTVTRAVDRYPDRPDSSVAVPPFGNHVVIRPAGVAGQTELFLCHLAEGSVTVAEGQEVAVGEPLGRVGNSGRSTEPHLHLHAVRRGGAGGAVPVLIAGRAPRRGRLLPGHRRDSAPS